ncbi:DUF2809 domain-containing protein [filamentous cyanobacterium LEGE 11480]|uniref:DUF2809 domain-containing protein n=1 Tax=Romeriopsis navalis LEGE 11480 TaxID=2777977 RepID=A0A928Z1H8_9CYAN|nr:DUF2809 domain-containing protein [Romeriopsis navalis]MBE9028519.1 DUF2809 domain-containing protein [Romeriopsis navalis LEGE 11480]
MSGSLFRFSPYRWVLLAQTLLLVPLGYGVRFAHNVPEWFRNIWGNVAYEMFWIFLFLTILPRSKPRSVAITICLMSFGIEFLQLCQHPFLVAARSTLPGRLVLGNGFTWIDLPQYGVGSLCGWLWAAWLQHQFIKRK